METNITMGEVSKMGIEPQRTQRGLCGAVAGTATGHYAGEDAGAQLSALVA